MDTAINVGLLFLGFLGAAAAIGGDTWHRGDDPALMRITRRGWLAIIALSLTLFLGVAKEFRARDAAENAASDLLALQQQLHETNTRLKDAASSRNLLANQLGDANRKLVQAQSSLQSAHTKLEKAERSLSALEPSILESMFELTERIPREQDFAFVQFTGRNVEIPRSSETDTALQLYGGDVFEYHLFCDRQIHPDELILDTGFRRYPIIENSGEIRISGPIGTALRGAVLNRQRRSDCGMKIIVRSTDRTRTQKQFDTLLDKIREAKRAVQ